MITTNYHTHTTRCGHASGTDEEYVLGAIAGGFKVLGFSDHTFLPDYNRLPTMRGDISELEPYCKSISHLRDKYSKDIEVFTALECEYYPHFHAYYAELLASGKMDYLILAAHYLEYDATIKRMGRYAGAISQPEEIVRYGEVALLGMNSGLFTYLAHPDLFMASYPRFDDTCEKVSRQIIARAIELRMPLEFNQGGIRFRGQIPIGDEVRYRYPVKQFWDIVREMKAPVILGVDAHSPADFTSEARYTAERLIDEWGLRSLVIEKLDIKRKSK